MDDGQVSCRRWFGGGRVCLWWVIFLVEAPRKLQRSPVRGGGRASRAESMSHGRPPRVTVLFLFCLSR